MAQQFDLIVEYSSGGAIGNELLTAERVMGTTTNASADWVGKTRMKLVAWWLPHAALVAGLLVAVPARTVIWIGALAWMGVACALNARRCADALPVHRAVLCRYDYSGGLGVVPAGLFGWLVLGAFIILGSKTIWWATERARGKFSQTVHTRAQLSIFGAAIKAGRGVPSAARDLRYFSRANFAVSATVEPS